MESNFIRRLLLTVIACTVTVSANAQNYEFVPDDRFFEIEGTNGRKFLVLVLPTATSDGNWTLPAANCAMGVCTFFSVELTHEHPRNAPSSDFVTKHAGSSIVAGTRVVAASGGRFVQEDRAESTLYGITFDDAVIPTNAQSITARITGTPAVIPNGMDLLYRIGWEVSRENDIITVTVIDTEIIFCNSAPTATDPLQCGKDHVRASGKRVVGDPSPIVMMEAVPVAPSSGGSSGAGAAVAVAAIGGVIYWLKKRNPKATYNFAAMPIDTDAYTAQFNYAPRKNWHINLEYTEGNLFASNDFVKPETNSTAKVTVKYTW